MRLQQVAAARVALGARVVIVGVRTKARDEVEEAARRREVGDVLEDVLLGADQLIGLGEQRRAARLDEQLARTGTPRGR